MAQVFRLAGWWRRAGAYVIDGVIVLLAARIIWSLFNGRVERWIDDERFKQSYEWRRSVGPAGWTRTDSYLAIAVVGGFALLLIVAALYSGFFMRRWNGATPGRKVTGIRVMRADGGRLTAPWCAARDVLARTGLAIVVGVITFGIGPLVMFLWPLIDREHRGVDDFIARSRVVIDEPPGWGEDPQPAEPAMIASR
jgi:uncharacterized RDD family membrane protein YckC